MSKCTYCQIDYPDGYVNEMIGFSPKMGGNFSKFVCGICALEISNNIHNERRSKFEAKLAEESRLKAIKFRAERIKKCLESAQM